MEEHGPILGVALVLAVSVWAYLLARQAARHVDQFREEHHESFLGDKKP